MFDSVTPDRELENYEGVLDETQLDYLGDHGVEIGDNGEYEDTELRFWYVADIHVDMDAEELTVNANGSDLDQVYTDFDWESIRTKFQEWESVNKTRKLH